MNIDIKTKLLEYVESKQGKPIPSVTDKVLVAEMRTHFPASFFYKTTHLTTKKMAALILLDHKEPTCEFCGKDISSRFPWKTSDTTSDRTTPFGAWARTCSASCNQQMIERDGKRKQTFLNNFGYANPMQNKNVSKKAIANRQTDWEKVGYEQQRRRLLKRGVSKEFVDSIDFSSDESKANAIIKIANEWKEQYGEYPDRFDLSTITRIDKQTLNRWLYRVPAYSHLFRSGNTITRAQKEIKQYIESLGSTVIISDRKTINPWEIDVFIPSHNIGIEYNGIWSHSEKLGKKDNTYHINKTTLCETKGIQLLHIYDTEWDDETGREIWKSIIKHKLGLIDTKIFARRCELKRISSSESNKFMDENHLQGSVKCSKHLGLYHDDVLVMCVAYGKSRFGDATEIIRMATKKNTIVVGGVSKLISVIKKETDHIVCYADRRYSTKSNCGYDTSLSYVNSTGPNWWGFHKSEYVLYSRFKFMKHKLSAFLKEYDASKTAFENMTNNGWDRIWDSGSLIYEWRACNHLNNR